ncbi:Transposon Tf2-9 poly, partial [Paramuricea clavata]
AIQDDILVTGKDDGDHLRNLKATLSGLQEYGVRLKLEKCKFMQESVTYMGCMISALGIQLTEQPHPLNRFLQKGREFKWSPEYERAYQSAKNSLSPANVLVHYNPELPLILECDASPYGVVHILYVSYAMKFTLYIDHKPLLKIYAPDSGIPVLAAARLQRWSLLLSPYHYEICHKSSADITNADALSGLPLKYRADASVEEPRLESNLRRSRFEVILQSSIEQGCLLWGLRVIIPPKFQKQVLSMLHEAHTGIGRMKAMSKSHVWWPKLDIAIEETVKSAYEGNHYLIVVEAHPKWPEVIGPMKSTTAGSTINALCCIFGRYGLPEQVVSDNGSPFQSVEYEDLLNQNGIQRMLLSPYHPASNGQAERLVQTFKNYLKTSSAQSCLLQRIQSFLLSYRGMPHSTTGCSPAKLFLQRELRTRLSLVKPDTASSNGKWQPATILERKEPHSYLIALPDGRIWKRHVDQLLQDSPPSPPLISERSELIPGNLGSPTDTQVSPTSSTRTSSTQSTPAAPVVPPPESMDRNPGPSELAQGTLGTPSIVTSPTIKLRRSSRMIKPPKRLIE